MKSRALVLIVLILIGGLFVLYIQMIRPPKPAPTVVGLEAPDFKVVDKNGKEITLESLKGKTVFVHFWAAWCTECRKEMPSINALYERKKKDPNFVFLGIIYREDPAKSKKYLKENNYTIPIFVDIDENAAKAFGVTGVPETYIIDPKGILKKKVIGPGSWENL
ncbi:MAG: TlpA family protein disulfide reductase [Nitrospirae bacterium]|nr:MAG: TlpA family protein disulfide reductase [Nitrospirota bacterium]